MTNKISLFDVLFSSGRHGGGWSRNGCSKAPSNFTHTVCKCHHLTSFAVVSDLKIEVSLISSLGSEGTAKTLAKQKTDF